MVMRQWIEVRQKKKCTGARTVNETTYFVSNVPTDVNREEIRKEFLRYGNVLDMYFPSRKGKNGQFYLFISSWTWKIFAL